MITQLLMSFNTPERSLFIYFKVYPANLFCKKESIDNIKDLYQINKQFNQKNLLSNTE